MSSRPVPDATVPGPAGVRQALADVWDDDATGARLADRAATDEHTAVRDAGQQALTYCWRRGCSRSP